MGNNKDDKSEVYLLLIKKLNVVEKCHKKGTFYCEKAEIWKEHRYNRNMVYYAPRIIDSIKQNNSFEVTCYDDIYFALIEFFIEFTGYDLPAHYRTNQLWLVVLNKKLPKDAEMKKALNSLLLKCTKINADKMISNVIDIKNMPEYQFILHNNTNKQG